MGTGVTAIIQSSSASIGILISLLSVDAITYQMAVPILLGDNIGTTITALYLIPSLPAILERLFIGLSNYFGWEISAGRMLANTHSAFNILNTLFWLPFVGVIVKVVTSLVPAKEVELKSGTKYIDERMIETPGVALDQTKKELIRMGELSQKSVAKAQKSFLNEDEDLIAEIKEIEEVINDLECSIVAYLTDISNQSLSEDDVSRLNGYLNIVDAIESVADNAENIAELAEYKVEHNLEFSEQAIEELECMFEKGDEILEISIKALEELDKKEANKILELEGKIDTLENDYRNSHLERLNVGDCLPVSGVVFLDVLKNIEHVGDQVTKIAYSVLEDLKSE